MLVRFPKVLTALQSQMHKGQLVLVCRYKGAPALSKRDYNEFNNVGLHLFKSH